MNKFERHYFILNLIKDNIIRTQSEITERLREAGADVTQATVSRDIKELKLVKTADNDNEYRYVSMATQTFEDLETRLSNIFAEAVISVEAAANIIVVKTLSGMAQAAATLIDSMEYKGLVGCIAGDDTIMTVAKTEKDAGKIADKLRLMLKN